MGKLNLIQQCAKAIAYLHQKEIVHLDLTTRNILLFANFSKLKLGDLGKVKQIALNIKAADESAHYMAPQVARGHDCDMKSNVYSFGIIFWEVMSEKKPFYLQNNVETGVQPSLNDIEDCQNYILIKPIIQLGWDSSPEKRPSMKELTITLSIYSSSFGDNKRKIYIRDFTFDELEVRFNCVYTCV